MLLVPFLCVLLPAFLGGPLAGLAATMLLVKGYRTGAVLVASGVLAIITGWMVILLSVVVGSVGTLAILAVACALVGNALAVEGAARSGPKPEIPPGVYYMLGLIIGTVSACMVGVFPYGSWGPLLAAFILVPTFAWLWSGGGLLACIIAFRLEPVGGYDAIDD